MENIIQPVAVLAAMGGLFGVLLSIASNVFKVEVDPKIEAVLDALPGANCGACGFPGCEGLAGAIAEGRAEVNACPIGGQPVADKIADIMGADAGDMEKEIAFVMCNGADNIAGDKYDYDGIEDCRIQSYLADGCKSCSYGCVGCGTCVDVCQFDAIHIVNGVAVVDREKCTACNKCIEICPKEVIDMVPYDSEYLVACNSNDSGRDVRGNCDLGCIGCQMCVRQCPEDAIEFDNLLVKIDYEKCTNCGTCEEKCPTDSIIIAGGTQDKIDKKIAANKAKAEKAKEKAV